MITYETEKSAGIEFLIFSICSVLVTSFLFFIDEGLYSFRWMTNWGSWIVFVIYAIPILMGQLLMSSILYKIPNQLFKISLSMVIGLSLGVSFVVGLVF